MDYNTLFAIKPEYQATVVGFNHSGLPLGKRNDLDKLALLAYHDRTLARYFVSLPSVDQIKAYQGGEYLTSTAPAAAPVAVPVVPAPGQMTFK